MTNLEFRGNISSTGYRSEFPFPYGYKPSLDEMKEVAQAKAQQLYNENPTKNGVMKPLL